MRKGGPVLGHGSRMLVLLLFIAISLAARAERPIETQLVTPGELRDALDRERGRVVVLNLWGTWCAPCLKEIPDLVALEQEYSNHDVVLIGLGMDEPDTLAELVEPFRRKYFPGFRSYLRNAPDMDTVVSVVDPAWNELLPTTYLIGRDGKVVKRIQGKRTLEQFRTEIEALLEGLPG